MPASSKQQHFEILRTVLALAEEQQMVHLDDAAAEVGIDVATLRKLLDPVLFLAFRTPSREMVSEDRAFLLTEEGWLKVDEEHWLRDLASEPPDPDTALRLLVAGLAYQAIAGKQTPDLDRALDKLRAVVAAHLHLVIEKPPCLGVAQDAWVKGLSLRFRYVSTDADTSDREVLPFRVYSKWGHWYVQGREVDGDDDVEFKHFRVDRMVDAAVGDV